MEFEECLRALAAIEPGDMQRVAGVRIKRDARGNYWQWPFEWGYGCSRVYMATILADPKPHRWEITAAYRKGAFWRDRANGRTRLWGHRWPRRKGRWGRREFRTRSAERQHIRKEYT